MFPFRHAAARLLTSRSVSIAARPRTITTFTSAQIRQPRFIAPLQFQRRWASNEAEAKKEEDDAPISEIQPTPQEEVENAIQTDNAPMTSDAATSTEAPQMAETANATEATEEHTSTAAEPESVQEAVDAPSFQAAQDAAASLTEGMSGSDSGAAQRPYKEPPSPRPTIYVGNLFFDVTENDLSKAFEAFGAVKEVRLIRDARGLSKGFGYVSFETTEEATNAISNMNQQLFEGRRLMVSYAYSDGNPSRREPRVNKPLNPPSKTLFIGNMSFDMTDRDLNNLFRGIRNVIDVRVAIDRRTGQPRGFAHADFIDVKSAQDAMKVLAGKEVYGRSLRVDYSYGPSAAPRNTPR